MKKNLVCIVVPSVDSFSAYRKDIHDTLNNTHNIDAGTLPKYSWDVLMMNFTTFSTEVKAGLIAKYDQQSLFTQQSDFSFNQYHKQNAGTVRNIITVHYNSIKGREDVQEYIITECMNAIIETATNQ